MKDLAYLTEEENIEKRPDTEEEHEYFYKLWEDDRL